MGSRANFPDGEEFVYVVERQKPNPICFGSKLVRNTGPVGKGLSPYQRRCLPEHFPKTGPGCHNIRNSSAVDAVLNKVRSRKGVGALASDAPRFNDKIHFWTPSPTKYDIDKNCWGRQVKDDKLAPFGSRTDRKTFKDNNNPGPGVYNVAVKKCRKTRFMYNFGQPSMIHTIEMICIPIPEDTCVKCDNICEGDYWQKDYTAFLCHICWEEEKYTEEIYSHKELKLFKRIRNCSFMHNHEGGTSAAIKLMPQNKINKKIRLENYLSLFIEC